MAGTDFLSLIGAIPSLISDFSGNTTAPYQQQQQALAGRNTQISNALTDTNNPLYQQLYGQYKQQTNNNLASTIAEAQGQNRMNAALGRTPLFSQERGSENIFRSLMQGQQNSGVQADQQTRQALMQAMGGNNTALNGYNNITPSTVAANKQQNRGFQDIGDLLNGLSNNKLFSNNGQQTLGAPRQQQPASNMGQPNVFSY